MGSFVLYTLSRFACIINSLYVILTASLLHKAIIMIFSESDKIKINNLITVLKHNNNIFIPLMLDYQKSGFQPQWDSMVNAKQNLTQAFISQCNTKPLDLFNLLRFLKDNNIPYKLEKNIDEDSGVLEEFYLFHKKDELFDLFKEATFVSDDFRKIILNTFSFEQIISFEKKQPDFFNNIIPYAYTHENKTFSYFINKKSYPYQKDFFLFLNNIKNEESLQNEFKKLTSLLLNDKLFLNMDIQKTLFSNFDSFAMFIMDNHQFSISHKKIMEKIFSLENNFYNIIQSQQFIDLFLVNFNSEKHAALIPFLKNAFIKMTPEQTSEIFVDVFTIQSHLINNNLISSIPEASMLHLLSSLLYGIKNEFYTDSILMLFHTLIKNNTAFDIIKNNQELNSLFYPAFEFLISKKIREKTMSDFFSDTGSDKENQEVLFLIKRVFPDKKSWIHKFFVLSGKQDNFENFISEFLNQDIQTVCENIQYMQENFPRMYHFLISGQNSKIKKYPQHYTLYESILLKEKVINNPDNHPPSSLKRL